MAAPLILARTFKDAHAYANDVLGLSFGYYRVVNSIGTLKAARGADLYLIPGWDKRPDRFSIKGALRYAHSLNIIDVATQEAEEPAAEPVEETLAEKIAGPGATNESIEQGALEEIAALLDEHDEPKPEPVAEPEVAPEPEVEPEPVKARRRRKCKTCEQMHYTGDPCDPENL